MFFRIVLTYIKLMDNSSIRYYKKKQREQGNRTKLATRINIFLKKKKKHIVNMVVVNDIKIFQNMKSKVRLSVEKSALNYYAEKFNAIYFKTTSGMFSDLAQASNLFSPGCKKIFLGAYCLNIATDSNLSKL